MAPPVSWEVPHVLHVLHGVNAAYKSQDLVHQPGPEHASTGMPDQRTTCAATQGIMDETAFTGHFLIPLSLTKHIL